MKEADKQTRILIVDDENNLIFTLSIIFKRKGYFVDIAENGYIALQMIIYNKLINKPYDLLITDVQMPHLTGEELIDKIRELKIYLPTIAITAYFTKERINHLTNIVFLIK